MPLNSPTILVTGIAGNLGRRLLPMLAGFNVIGVDMRPPEEGFPQLTRFEPLDLGEESSCDELITLLRDSNVSAVVHLAFVLDPQRTGILDKARMWRINVDGTARVLEAVAQVNRFGGAVSKIIVPSSVSVYGPDIPGEADESFPLAAHTLTYAVHKKEADQVVQLRAPSLSGCATYLLRPHIFAGHSMQNYMVGALRGTPGGGGRLGAFLRGRGARLPMLLPAGKQYLEKRLQFVHVDDVARLVLFILERAPADSRLRIFNVAGRGGAVTLAHCADVANATVLRLPGKSLCRAVLALLWKAGVSDIPPEAYPYMCGSYVMDTRKLRDFLGAGYPHVVRFTVEQALADSFATSHHEHVEAHAIAR